MVDDPEAEAVRKRVVGEPRFFMTGPGGSCDVHHYPSGKCHVFWTGAELNWGDFDHQDLVSAIRRAIDFGCPNLVMVPEVDDERMTEIWELIKKQANISTHTNRVRDG